ncbi:transposase [Bradyrhizobium diazoefficiens]|nr:transposase [Bradyrhizobium diazoefficiens]QQN65444.1 transposase [Bradyrhizobium diazoefficiens]
MEVSTICQALPNEFETFRERDLSGVSFDYLFCDAPRFKMHAVSESADPMLAA